MPWNSTWPVGGVSVKANRTSGQENTTYIETTMGNSVVGTNTNTTRDHFWDVGSNEDGRHRFINSPAFTVGATAANPVIGTGMDAVFYLKTINTRAEWFHRNASNIFQVTPGYLTGTVVLAAGYSNVVAVPASVWGEIFMWTTAQGNFSGQTGFFRSNGATVESWALYLGPQGEGESLALKFGNGTDASGLNIRARPEDAAAGQTWFYRIMYRAI